MSNSLILPWLQDNFESIHKYEEEIRTKSILFINSNPALKDHMDLIYESLDMIYTFSFVHKNNNDDELTIQFLGIRLFNSIVSSIKLFLSGYYQVALMVMRDILETGYLVDYFTIDKSKISHWKASSNEERKKEYSPAVIRKALDERSGLKGEKRREKYQSICEYASHPTYQGNKLISTNGLGQIGPFIDEKALKAVVEELVMQLSYTTIIFTEHFKNSLANILKVEVDYLDKNKHWFEKYFNTDLSHVDTEYVKELTKYL